MGTQPVFGTGDDLIEVLCLRRALQFRLALPFLHPEDGIVAVGVDGLLVLPLLPAECQRVDDGQKLTDIVGAVNWTIMEHASSCLQIDGLIFHWPRIARAGCIYSPCVCPHLGRQGQYGVMSVIWRILNHKLHAFGHFDAKEGHTALDNFGNILSQHEADGFLLLIRLVENREVVVELVEHLRQLVTVVGDTTG